MTKQAAASGTTETTVSVAGKKGAKVSGDVLHDIASEIEGLTKAKALKDAHELAERVEHDYFRLGGILRRIYENSWFDGHESFGAYVAAEFGFQERKAKYLMKIYENLVDKMIPWEKVSVLGWTKLKDLSEILTPENVDEWVAKAEPITVFELQQLLKGDKTDSSGTSGKTTSDITPVKFQFKPDALETVQTALAKAKGETGTEYDSVAIENICSGYLSGSISGGGSVSLESMMKDAGYEKVLEIFDTLFPEIDLEVVPPNE